MRLLITTQAVDRADSNLGSFLRWIEEFAKHCERVEVLCLRAGDYALPRNVSVHSLGKERGAGRLRRVWRALRLVVLLRNDYDAVFVHMNPEYALLFGPLWRLWGKRVGLWYTHKAVNPRLRVAAAFVNVIFTASKESFRLRSRKVRVVGHGIDSAAFALPRHRSDVLRIATVGRISSSKRIIEMLRALDVLHAGGVKFRFAIYGAPIVGLDRAYEARLLREIQLRPYRTDIAYAGPVPHDRIPEMLADTDVFLNLSTTGSVDRAVLEAIAAGAVPVSSNEAFGDMLMPRGLFVPSVEPKSLAQAILRARQTDLSALRAEVAGHHSLQNLVPRILSLLADESH